MPRLQPQTGDSGDTGAAATATVSLHTKSHRMWSPGRDQPADITTEVIVAEEKLEPKEEERKMRISQIRRVWKLFETSLHSYDIHDNAQYKDR